MGTFNIAVVLGSVISCMALPLVLWGLFGKPAGHATCTVVSINAQHSQCAVTVNYTLEGVAKKGIYMTSPEASMNAEECNREFSAGSQFACWVRPNSRLVLRAPGYNVPLVITGSLVLALAGCPTVICIGLRVHHWWMYRPID